MSIQCWIVNNSGSLMFSYSSPTAPQKETNWHLSNASSLATTSALAQSSNPGVGGSGFTKIETTTKIWTCFTSATGLKIFLCDEKENSDISQQKTWLIYEAYCLYVLRNPFSILGETIKCKKFEDACSEILQE